MICGFETSANIIEQASHLIKEAMEELDNDSEDEDTGM